MSNQKLPFVPDMFGLASMSSNVTQEFVKNFWGAFKVPGMPKAILTVEDLDKQISDLKAVETWFTLNMGILRTTIQTMEAQRSGLAMFTKKD
jgi:hypothetical protein